MSKRGWLLFAAMSVIWGIPFMFIKVALVGVSAPFLVGARTALGALVLLPIALSMGQLRPALRQWRWVLAFAIIEVAIPWMALSDAEVHISSSLSGLLVSATPLISTVIVWRLGDASAVSGRRLIGLAVGVAGVAAIVWGNVGSASPLRMAEVLLVPLGYSIAPVIADRKLNGVPALGLTTLSLSVVALIYLPVDVVTRPLRMPSPTVLAAIVVLGLVCTAVAFLLLFRLIAEVGPVRASMTLFVNPVVAAIVGVAVLGESVGRGTIIGAVLALSGAMLSARRRSGPTRLPHRIDGEYVPAGGVDTSSVPNREASGKHPAPELC